MTRPTGKGRKKAREVPSRRSRKPRRAVLDPREMGRLAKKLASITDAGEAEQLKKRMLQGFYGAQLCEH